MKRIVIVGAIGVVAIVAALILSGTLEEEQGAPPVSEVAVQPAPAPAEPPAPSPADPQTGTETATVAPVTVPATQQQQQPSAAVPSAAGQEKPGEGGPTFDVVRINPRGNAVIAGRARPNSSVTVYDGDKEVGTVIADSRGEWVLLPGEPFAPGSRELTLSAKDESGKVANSGQSVVLVVPGRKEEGSGETRPSAVAVLVPNAGNGGTVLQPPSSEGGEGIAQDGLSLDIIDYDEKGQVVVGGRAPAGANVQVYIDNEPVGGVVAGGDGRWQVKPDKPVEPGLHTLRVDQVEPPDAKVVARVETPFSRAAFAEAAPGTIVVQPGNSLWRIARRTYGHGVRYSLIFEANKNQIRDPDLIYPGQVFSLPNQQQ